MTGCPVRIESAFGSVVVPRKAPANCSASCDKNISHIQTPFTWHLIAQMTFPSNNIVVPNMMVFSALTTLTVLTVTVGLPESCSQDWETCVLDSTETLPVIVLFYGNAFHKSSSKRKHLEFLRSILPRSSATRTELVLMYAIVVNAAFHLYLILSLKPFTPQHVAYIASYVFIAVLAISLLIQFGSVVHEINRKFSRLIKKSQKLNLLLLSEQWDVFEAIDSVNKIYGLPLMILSMWVSGKLVNNLYKAARVAVFDRDVFLSVFLCASALLKFFVFLFAMHKCEQTKLLAEAFNNELFKLMHFKKELRRDSKLFLYVSMRKTVKFTACGFFNLGYPLVTSVIAAATTYLVILLQFTV